MSAIPDLIPPKCPHCGKPLPTVGLYAYEVPGFAILNLYCPHCEVAVHWQIFQRPMLEGEKPRVSIPS